MKFLYYTSVGKFTVSGIQMLGAYQEGSDDDSGKWKKVIQYHLRFLC